MGDQGVATRPHAGVSVQAMAQVGLTIALLAVSAQVSVAIGPVPFTLQTLVVALAAMIFSPAQAAGALAGYALLGAIGLPVFSMAGGGIGKIAGPTGGFIYGFIASAFLGSLVRRAISGASRTPAGTALKPARVIAGDVACVLVTLVVCYVVGTAHFMAIYALGDEAVGLVATLGMTVFPFIVPDLAKGVAAMLVAAALRKALPQLARR